MRLTKKLTAFLMASVLAAGLPITGIPALSMESFADYKKTDGAYRMLDGTAIEGVHARGIDVSHWQGAIDWNAVAADDIQFVMLGTRYSGNIDPYFDTNARSAAAAGLDVGVYIYSYATSVEAAEAEADFVLSLIKDYKISYPVAFDMEDNSQTAMTKEELAAMANAFCKKIRDAGYYPIIYANDYWLANKLDMSLMPYPVWVARYQQKHNYQKPIMWQATSTGRVNGVNGNVDIDFQYTDLNQHLPANLWRTIFGTTYYYQNHQRAKNTWIQDADARYYIQEDGTAYRGWRQENGSSYLLSHDSGKLATGWYMENGRWYYLKPDTGAMSTGWQSADNSWYYMNPSDGVMQTGWLDQNGRRFFLRDGGAMVTGWRNLGDRWYYFNPGSGEMNTSGWNQINNSWYYLTPGSGELFTAGWLNNNGSWYYVNPDGAMQTGLIDVGGIHYYLEPSSGVMQADTTVTVNGTTYNAAADGSLSIPTAGETPVEGVPQTQVPSGSGSQPPVQSVTPPSTGSGTSPVGPGQNLLVAPAPPTGN